MNRSLSSANPLWFVTKSDWIRNRIENEHCSAFVSNGLKGEVDLYLKKTSKDLYKNHLIRRPRGEKSEN